MVKNDGEPLGCQPKVPARFWKKVKRSRSCWLWTAAKSDGYGLFWFGGKLVAAHRFVYAALVGAIPDDREVDHVCRKRHCVRPDHLRLLSHRDNVLAGANISADRARRERCPVGHEFTVITRGGARGTQRRCVTCRRAYQREYDRRRRALKRAGLL